MKSISWSFLFRLSLTFLLAGILLYTIGIETLIAHFKQIQPIWGILSLSSLFTLFLLGAFNVWILLNTMYKIPLWRFFICYLYSWAMGLLLPGQVGDASIVLFLRKYEVSFRHSSLAYLIDKGITVFILFLVGLYGIPLFFPEISIFSIFLIYMLGIIFSLMLLILIVKYSYLCKPLLNLINKITEILKELTIFRTQWKILLLNICITIGKWFVLSLTYYLAFRAFSSHVPWPEIGVIPILSTLVGYIPLTVAGIGTVEYSAVYLFSLIGIAKATVLAAYILLRSLQYILAGFMIILFSLINPANIRDDKTHEDFSRTK